MKLALSPKIVESIEFNRILTLRLHSTLVRLSFDSRSTFVRHFAPTPGRIRAFAKNSRISRISRIQSNPTEFNRIQPNFYHSTVFDCVQLSFRFDFSLQLSAGYTPSPKTVESIECNRLQSNYTNFDFHKQIGEQT